MALNGCYSIYFTAEAFGLKICESSPYIFAFLKDQLKQIYAPLKEGHQNSFWAP